MENMLLLGPTSGCRPDSAEHPTSLSAAGCAAPFPPLAGATHVSTVIPDNPPRKTMCPQLMGAGLGERSAQIAAFVSGTALTHEPTVFPEVPPAACRRDSGCGPASQGLAGLVGRMLSRQRSVTPKNSTPHQPTGWGPWGQRAAVAPFTAGTFPWQ